MEQGWWWSQTHFLVFLVVAVSPEESEDKEDEDGEDTQKRYNLWQRKRVIYSLDEQFSFNVLFFSKIDRGRFAIPISERSDMLSTEM